MSATTPQTWTRACASAQLSEATPISVEVAGEPICLVRTGGQVFAIRDVCSHADVPLSEGEVEDGTIECWLHGSRFDLRTGEPTGLPATRPVAVYPVSIEGDDVLVAVGDQYT